ncbi:hypothetical protein [Granulicella mallensis]|uniref:Uncharacterized protein n=1 Tax=Granulicella mallensis TaxID=940614 RepID=A0A7W7ZP30_9BACT|nr:hypothetical protein [Granulicella mallensis]MBB5063119.1 hypothetical protein [Granulicella mallensis]
MSSLSDEYKILQDKIDKIGAFRVTIKGWSVTATIGALVAIASGKGFSPAISSFAVNVLLAWFFWFEREQVRLGWLFGGRARNIEIQIDKHRRATGEKVTFSTPNIARSLFGTKKPRPLISHTFKNDQLNKVLSRINKEARLAIKSDLIFYLVLGLAAWLPKWFGVTPQSPSPSVTIQNTIQPATQPLLDQNSQDVVNASGRRAKKNIKVSK